MNSDIFFRPKYKAKNKNKIDPQKITRHCEAESLNKGLKEIVVNVTFLVTRDHRLLRLTFRRKMGKDPHTEVL